MISSGLDGLIDALGAASQHLQSCALDQGARDRGDANGNSRRRGHRVQVIEKIRGLRPANAAEFVETAIEETFSAGALAAHPNQQSARTHSARDQTENSRR
jgi:hypothetical protein